jgi:hypothetical protein
MAPVLSIFHAYPEFIFDYYSHMVTAIVAIVMTLIMMMIMRKVFRLCTSEHTFWLILPMLYFIALTVFAAQAMLIGLLFAALPIIIILAGAAVYFRLGGLKSNQSVLLS